jgi:hypothetical protein
MTMRDQLLALRAELKERGIPGEPGVLLPQFEVLATADPSGGSAMFVSLSALAAAFAALDGDHGEEARLAQESDR